tara:strand:+ start:1676 stop:2659 length:984 start_codon:yes stop_codon:yes gene_type:complete
VSIKKIFIIVLFIIGDLSWSAEVDNFTGRFNRRLQDSTNIFNKKTNEFFRKGLKNANIGLLKCNEKKLYFNLKQYFNSTFFGKIVRWVNETDTLDKRFISVKKSIYRDFTPNESIVLGFLSKLRPVHSPNLRMGEVYLGSDKFEHFFSSGYRYFSSHYGKGKSLRKTLMIGLREEYGLLGRYPTGVISYADLAADFNGMRFWNHVLQKKDDVLGSEKNLGPYVKCINKKWTLVKEMDWSNYLDDSMDEAINCSQFKSKNMVKKIKKRLQELQVPHQRIISCPINRNKLKKVVLKYGKYSDFFINQYGLRVVDLKDNPLKRLKESEEF